MVDPQGDYQKLPCLTYFELSISFSTWHSALPMGWQLTLLDHNGIVAWTRLVSILIIINISSYLFIC